MMGMAPPFLVVTPTKGHMGWDEPGKRSTGPTHRTLVGALRAWRTEVTGKKSPACFQKAGHRASRPKKRVAFATLFDLVGTIGLEPTTPTMSRWCSNQLSYVPSLGAHSIDSKNSVKRFFANLLKIFCFSSFGKRVRPVADSALGVQLVSRQIFTTG